LKFAQTKVMKAGVRIVFALALSVMLFLPAASADSTITLTSPNAETNGYFGSVAINEGDPIVVVGAPGETADTFSGAGHAYILDTTTGLITTLKSPNAQLNGGFGASVAVSGTTVVVGAYGETAKGHHGAGHAYVFDATDGSLITTLTSPTPQDGGSFGAVSISGTTVVVGAPGENGNAGRAYVFDATSGSLITTLTSPNTNALVDIFFFGASVSISGTTVVVGAYDDTTNGLPTNEGHAYVFDATDGSLITTLTSPNANAQIEGRFGISVSISGTTVVVGAPYERPNAVLDAGRAYVFDATTSSLIATLTSPYTPPGGLFGSSVAISGTTVVVGAYQETANGQAGAGHAYSFDASAGFLTTTLTSPNVQTIPGYFGASVAVSGTTVVVGAPQESGSGFFYAGHAYIFP
jgi:hypothetical protein